MEQDIMEPVHLIGTAAAAIAVEEFLQNGRQFYTSNNWMMWLVPLTYMKSTVSIGKWIGNDSTIIHDA